MQGAAKAVAPKRGRANRANSGHSAASLGMSSLGMPMAASEIPNDSEEEVSISPYDFTSSK